MVTFCTIDGVAQMTAIYFEMLTRADKLKHFTEVSNVEHT